MLGQRHPNVASIRAKASDLQTLWHAVNEAANERQQALLDGKNIHLIDAKADELLNRLAEQEAHIMTMEGEDLSNADVHTVQAYAQRHEAFLHSLWTIEKQVAELSHEVDRVMQEFPRTQVICARNKVKISNELKGSS